MTVSVIVREVLERVMGEVTKFNVVKEYTLDIHPSDLLDEFNESREVWGEYDVMFVSHGFSPLTLVKSMTYKEELTRKQDFYKVTIY